MVSKSISLFYSYSHKDEGLRQQLETHLSALRRGGVISEWHDRKIGAGDDWESSIDHCLETSQIILLLISADFLASEYCYGKELRLALKKDKEGKAKVIPIILRACDWKSTPIGRLQALPKDAKPVTSWKNSDEAWTNIALSIRASIQSARLNQEFKASEGKITNDIKARSIDSVLINVIDRLDENYQNDNPYSGIPSGYVDLDDFSGGFEKGDLVVVASRPSMAKTSFITSISEHCAINQELPVIFFTFEATDVQLVTRMLSSIGRIPHINIKTANILDEHWPQLTSAVSKLQGAPLYVISRSEITEEEFTEEVSLICGSKPPAIIIIDNVNVFSDDLNRSLRFFKKFAIKVDAPVIVTMSLGQHLEKRANKRPVLNDFGKDSHSIDNYVDRVIFLYRDEVYNEDSPDKGTVEVITAKNRNGPVGVVRLIFADEYLNVSNYSS